MVMLIGLKEPTCGGFYWPKMGQFANQLVYENQGGLYPSDMFIILSLDWYSKKPNKLTSVDDRKSIYSLENYLRKMKATVTFSIFFLYKLIQLIKSKHEKIKILKLCNPQ